ncbi:MFS transporter [Kitasatospora sp. McL0602]|uniref:MFS transporter n=1 Tax=Kitasatospora sp. McL0602 TaxID=3439530 RepID=UPI003F8AD825
MGISTEQPSRESWLVARGVILEAGPRRTLALASFVNMVGGAVFMLTSALYFTRSVGFSVAQVGLGAGVGALVGVLAGVPVGRLADRRGPREVYLVTLTVQAAAMAALVLVRSFWLFVLVICLTELAGSASGAAKSPLVRGFAGERPAKYRAYLRATVNLAGSLGALLAALVVQLDTRAAYTCLVLGNALSFLLAALIAARLPETDRQMGGGVACRWLSPGRLLLSRRSSAATPSSAPPRLGPRPAPSPTPHLPVGLSPARPGPAGRAAADSPEGPPLPGVRRAQRRHLDPGRRAGLRPAAVDRRPHRRPALVRRC